MTQDKRGDWRATVEGLVPTLLLLGYPVLALVLMIFGQAENSFGFSLFFRCLVAVLALYVFFSTLDRGADPKLKYCLLLLAFFLFTFGVRIVFESEIKNTPLPHSTTEYFAYLVIVTALPPIAALNGLSHSGWHSFYKSLFVFSLLFSALAAVFFAQTSANYAIGASGRFGTQTLNPISLAAGGGIVLIFAISTILSWAEYRVRFSVPRWHRPVMILLAVAGATLLILGASRGPIIGCTVAIVLLVMQPLSVRRLVIGSLASIMALLLLHWVAVWLYDSFGITAFQRFISLIEDPYIDQSAFARITSFSGALDHFLDSPFLGEALVESRTGLYPHNILLEAFMATGILGGIPFGIVVLYSGYCAIKLMAIGQLERLIGAVTVLLLNGSMFSGSIQGSGTTIFFGFLSIALLNLQRGGFRSSKFRRLTNEKHP